MSRESHWLLVAEVLDFLRIMDAGWFEWLGGHGLYVLTMRGASVRSSFRRSGWSVLRMFAGSVFLAVI